MNQTDYHILFQEKRMIRYLNADSHVVLAILYLFAVIAFGIYLLIKIVDLFASYCSYRNPGDRFDVYVSILPDFYSELYNNIDAADLTPAKQPIRKFFGYETSNDI